MIIFLDFDGVLHPVDADNNNLFSRRTILHALFRQFAFLKCVYTTSWREDYTVEALTSELLKGAEDIEFHRILGATPCLLTNHSKNSGKYVHIRHEEILLWIAGNQSMKSEKWIAIDDKQNLFLPGCSNLYLTDGNNGLDSHDFVILSSRISSLI